MFFRNFRQLFLKRSSKFIFCGLINLILTNIILQLLLFFNTLTLLATLISQLFNFFFGYFLYSTKVFERAFYKRAYFFRFIFLAIALWNMNWFSISYISNYNISRNIASLLIAPFLGVFSYYFQKRFIFSS